MGYEYERMHVEESNAEVELHGNACHLHDDVHLADSSRGTLHDIDYRGFELRHSYQLKHSYSYMTSA